MKRIDIPRASAAQPAYLTLAIAGLANSGALPGRDLRGLIDTGASHVQIRRSILEEAGIPLSNVKATTTLAAGQGGFAVPVHVDIVLPCRNEVGLPATFTITMMAYAIADLSEEVLVGLDLLQHFDLSFSRSGVVSLTR